MIVIETMRVKSTHPELQGPFIVINKADFDPEKHESLDGEADADGEVEATAELSASDDAPVRRSRKAKVE